MERRKREAKEGEKEEMHPRLKDNTHKNKVLSKRHVLLFVLCVCFYVYVVIYSLETRRGARKILAMLAATRKDEEQVREGCIHFEL